MLVHSSARFPSLDAMTHPRKISVTVRALIQRINRRLPPDGELVRTTRGTRAQSGLGDHYRLDIRNECVVETAVDFEALGRELSVLRQFEVLADG
jgi:hypothetical protein